jgi:sugar O-acyltransferase (sialic acid O-acetyltransferase NeuD family)
VQQLVIVGAGGFARETVELVRAVNATSPKWDLVGLLDDNPDLVGQERTGTTVIGTTDWLHDHEDVRVAVCLGSPASLGLRQRVVRRLDLPPERFATLIHPSSILPTSVSVGEGTVIHAGTVCTADVVIGRHVAVMPLVVLTHDNRIGDFVTIGAGVRLAGSVSIQDTAYVGAGALVREHVTIGESSMTGMGSVILRDVPPNETWAGVPARRL